MKTCLLFALALLLSISAGLGPAQAQPPGLPTGFPWIVNFNENCVGTYIMDSQYIPLDCKLTEDPLNPGVLVPTFFFPPGQLVVPGDVVGVEPDGSFTDLIRFVPDDPVTGLSMTLRYYSEVDPNEPVPPPSDVGLPADFQANMVTVPEMGTPEFFDWIIYTPDGISLYVAVSDSQDHGGPSPPPPIARKKRGGK